jgi:cytochrome c biogenesis protein CcdA
MVSGKIIELIVLGMISAALLTYAFFTSQEKGPILSNTWFSLTKEERKTADKKAEYHLVTVVFGLLGLEFLLMTVEVIVDWAWLSWIKGILIIFLIAYALIESIKTEVKRKR